MLKKGSERVQNSLTTVSPTLADKHSLCLISALRLIHKMRTSGPSALVLFCHLSNMGKQRYLLSPVLQNRTFNTFLYGWKNSSSMSQWVSWKFFL